MLLKDIIPESLVMEITLEGKQSAKAEKLVNYLFETITDKTGECYLNHLHNVARNFQDEMRYSVGLLHDIIEDTKITMTDLAILGFRESYIEAIMLLTKKEFETYDEYIDRLISSDNTVVLDIKLADITHNMNEERLSRLSAIEKEKFLKKYIPAKIKVEERRKKLL
ncbi:MAG: hypothetical protein IJO33_03690 [Bacilli bacterium]|nr:hypothetical protein [Bacilli bacterium]